MAEEKKSCPNCNQLADQLIQCNNQHCGKIFCGACVDYKNHDNPVCPKCGVSIRPRIL